MRMYILHNNVSKNSRFSPFSLPVITILLMIIFFWYYRVKSEFALLYDTELFAHILVLT